MIINLLIFFSAGPSTEDLAGEKLSIVLSIFQCG